MWPTWMVKMVRSLLVRDVRKQLKSARDTIVIPWFAKEIERMITNTYRCGMVCVCVSLTTVLTSIVQSVAQGKTLEYIKCDWTSFVVETCQILSPSTRRCFMEPHTQEQHQKQTSGSASVFQLFRSCGNPPVCWIRTMENHGKPRKWVSPMWHPTIVHTSPADMSVLHRFRWVRESRAWAAWGFMRLVKETMHCVHCLLFCAMMLCPLHSCTNSRINLTIYWVIPTGHKSYRHIWFAEIFNFSLCLAYVPDTLVNRQKHPPPPPSSTTPLEAVPRFQSFQFRMCLTSLTRICLCRCFTCKCVEFVLMLDQTQFWWVYCLTL